MVLWRERDASMPEIPGSIPAGDVQFSLFLFGRKKI